MLFLRENSSQIKSNHYCVGNRDYLLFILYKMQNGPLKYEARFFFHNFNNNEDTEMIFKQDYFYLC